MNKKDAADYLGISPRTLEWHTKQGNIGVRYVKGKTGDVADYDEGELRGLKAKLDNQRTPRALVVREGHESPDSEPRSLARLADLQPDQFAEMLARAYAASMGEVMQRWPAMLLPAPNGHEIASHEIASYTIASHGLQRCIAAGR